MSRFAYVSFGSSVKSMKYLLILSISINPGLGVQTIQDSKYFLETSEFSSKGVQEYERPATVRFSRILR